MLGWGLLRRRGKAWTKLPLEGTRDFCFNSAMKSEGAEKLLYPDDYAELMRRVEEGRVSGVWSEDVWAFLDEAEMNLGGREAVTTKHDFAEA